LVVSRSSMNSGWTFGWVGTKIDVMENSRYILKNDALLIINSFYLDRTRFFGFSDWLLNEFLNIINEDP